MKKLFLMAASLLFIGTGIAQTRTVIVQKDKVTTTTNCCNSNGFKPGEGDVTADFSIFSKGILETPFAVQALKLRYFIDNNWALRGELSHSSNTTTSSQKNDSATREEFAKKQKSNFGFGLGVEYHFNGTGRLSPYIGGELSVSSTSQSQYNSTTQSDKNKVSSILVKGPNGFGGGCSLFLGADYYIARHLYLGAEAGWGIDYTKTGGVTTVTTDDINSTTIKSNATGGTFTGGNSIQAGFKIGFVF